MNILAIDSSGLVAATALQSDEILVGEYTIHNKKTHSQTLLPMIHDLLKMADLTVDVIDAVAVASGPGSFTGLRIGAATAKGLAQALRVPVIPVPTLEALAWNLAGSEALVCPLMDARRDQVYYGIYDVSGETPVALAEQKAAPIGEALEKADELGRPVIFLGDGVPVFAEQLKQVRVPWKVAAENLRYQKASSTASLGLRYFRQGKSVPPEEFVPVYLRMSQAERERMERNGTA